MMLGIKKELNNRFLDSIVISKKIDSDKYLYKSFMLSFCLHVSIILFVFFVSSQEKEKPILLNTHEKTIAISVVNMDVATPKNLQTKEKNYKKIELAQTKPVNKMIEPVALTQKSYNKAREQTLQKMEPLQNKIVPSSEAFTPQISSNAEQNIKASIVQTSISDIMNSPSLSKLPPKKAQQFDIGKEQLARIRSMIENALCYPAIAKKLRLEGVVLVSFSLWPDGYVQNIQIVSSSGSSVLDKKALQTVASLDGEYPHLEKKVDLTLPISFSLKKS